MTTEAGLDLFWLPLGAGGHSVRWNGRLYEAACALLSRRRACDLYHSALRVHLPAGSWTVEMTPGWAAGGGEDRGVVAEGAVGSRFAGRARLFRYEVHSWRDGTIGDVGEAVGGAVRLSSDPAVCRRLLALLPRVPRPVWGRDELRAGEMWNSNSVTSWALTRSGLDASTVRPPGAGRAPGWDAGIVVARRQEDAGAGTCAPPRPPARPPVRPAVTRSPLFALTRTALVLVPLLRRRAGARLGRHLAVIDDAGRRSGRRRHLVTQDVRDGRTFRIAVGMPDRKTWWRNSVDRPLRVRLAGRGDDATAHAVRDGDRVQVVGDLGDVPAAPGTSSGSPGWRSG